MSLRKPGYTPKRRGTSFRKRKAIILINTEGKNETETNYLRGFIGKNVPIHFCPGRDTDPVNMVNQLIKKMKAIDFDKSLGDKAFCLIDSDLNPKKNTEILAAEVLAVRKGIELIVSAPCFEDWFLCHFVFSTKQYVSNDELIADLKKKVPNYSKNRIDMYEELIPHVDNAIKNSKKQEAELYKIGKTKHTVDFSPSTEAYRVIEGIDEVERQNQK